MKKLTALIVLFLLTISLSAASYLFDNASLLTTEERTKLEAELENVSNKTGISTVIVTSNYSTSYSTQDRADLFIEKEEYGNDGVCLYLNMGDREWAVSTSGYGAYALSDRALSERSLSGVLFPYLSNGEYMTAFSNFARYVSVCSEYSPRSGYNTTTKTETYTTKTPFNWPISAAFSFTLAAFISLLIVLRRKRKLRNTGYVRDADDYIVRDTFKVNVHRDIFLYSNIVRVPRPRDDDRDSHHTSFHTSSSGQSHGGRSGHF